MLNDVKDKSVQEFQFCCTLQDSFLVKADRMISLYNGPQIELVKKDMVIYSLWEIYGELTVYDFFDTHVFSSSKI